MIYYRARCGVTCGVRYKEVQYKEARCRRIWRRTGPSCCSMQCPTELELVHYDLNDVLPLCHGTHSYGSGGVRTRQADPCQHAPMSPHANFLPMGPTTWYPTTSRTTLICSAVSGCSYISVFIAGKTYVGVVGARARNREVYPMISVSSQHSDGRRAHR